MKATHNTQFATEVAVVGAGPYGLSIGAYLRHHGVAFRIFGRVMDTWLNHMPRGMLLKSDGFASNLCDPESRFTLRQYCAETGIEYGDSGIPVRLETFTAYGKAFQERMLPELEHQLVSSIERIPGGFLLQVNNGEALRVRQVVIAVGITHFALLPSCLMNLPLEYVSHASGHRDLESFQGREVVVIGSGASALDLAGLLHQSGAKVQIVSRRGELKFHGKSTGQPSWWQRLRNPQSGIGPGYKLRLIADAPNLFRYLPQDLRLEAVRRVLGPAGGWFCKDMVIGKVPALLGYAPQRAEIQDGAVRLHLHASDGTKREIVAEHVIAATGYRPDLDRLTFLSKDIRSALQAVENTPILKSTFESSLKGLYFVGPAAANSFGPVMRFAFGARFAAKRVAGTILRSASRQRAIVTGGLLAAKH